MDETTETYDERENQWDDQWPTLGQNVGGHPPEEVDNLDEELGFPDVVGTIESEDAVRDAEPYTPPTDPPVLPGGDEGIHVATGFGMSADEEDAKASPPRGDEEIRERAELELEQDSLTSLYDLHVDVNDGVIRLVGAVDSVDVAEHATWMLGELQGVVDVIDDTTLSPSGV